ncbi:MAG TPA: S8 family serine peptidase [Pyrinomonadaceae bacterium]|nr:S8 family serine peptidase [Pyrinomonadaceae bacterium]
MATLEKIIDSSKISEHAHGHAQNRFAVIPLHARLAALENFTGRGVTMAFLDSGFYPHPDLIEPRNRVAAFKDMAGEGASFEPDQSPQSWQWHGTQTSVVAAGNGRLSDGLYRGLAPDARLVLVKASERGRITEETIARGIEWVVENRERYDIRVLNISLGGDEDIPCSQSIVDLAAEGAVRAGIVVVAAAGNSGDAERHTPVPPANSPSVITVGGYDDRNQLSDGPFDLYHSNFGATADQIVKPELIAPAIWVAAPILPGTTLYSAAEALSRLASAPDYELPRLARDLDLPEEFSLPRGGADEIRAALESLLRRHKIVATHYQHVDGTSFAAPVVSSLVAQMIEANPELSPDAVKNILVSTADRLGGAPAVRQGYGAINARRAVEMARRERHGFTHENFSPPRVCLGKLIFAYHDDAATAVALAGDFNDWESSRTPFSRDAMGIWRLEMEPPPRGRYRYKLVVDGGRWVDDPSNGLKEPDEFGGFNSLVNIG